MKNELYIKSSNEDLQVEVSLALPDRQSGCPESDGTDSGIALLSGMTNDRPKNKKIIRNKEKGIQKIRFIVQLLFAL